MKKELAHLAITFDQESRAGVKAHPRTYEELIDAAVYVKGFIEQDKHYLSVESSRCDVAEEHAEHFYDYEGPWRYCDGTNE